MRILYAWESRLVFRALLLLLLGHVILTLGQVLLGHILCFLGCVLHWLQGCALHWFCGSSSCTANSMVSASWDTTPIAFRLHNTLLLKGLSVGFGGFNFHWGRSYAISASADWGSKIYNSNSLWALMH